jgi:hypothetical protein
MKMEKIFIFFYNNEDFFNYILHWKKNSERDSGWVGDWYTVITYFRSLSFVSHDAEREIDSRTFHFLLLWHRMLPILLCVI